MLCCCCRRRACPVRPQLPRCLPVCPKVHSVLAVSASPPLRIRPVQLVKVGLQVGVGLAPRLPVRPHVPFHVDGGQLACVALLHPRPLPSCLLFSWHRRRPARSAIQAECAECPAQVYRHTLFVVLPQLELRILPNRIDNQDRRRQQRQVTSSSSSLLL